MTFDIEKYKRVLDHILDFCVIITLPIWLLIVMIIVAVKVIFFFLDYVFEQRSIFGQ
mgnify:CR=1 FL=1